MLLLFRFCVGSMLITFCDNDNESVQHELDIELVCRVDMYVWFHSFIEIGLGKCDDLNIMQQIGQLVLHECELNSNKLIFVQKKV